MTTNQQPSLGDRLSKFNFNPKLRLYDTQKSIVNQLKAISQLLSAYDPSRPDPNINIHAEYAKWLKFYLEHYYELFDRKKSTDRDPSIDFYFRQTSIYDMMSNLGATNNFGEPPKKFATEEDLPDGRKVPIVEEEVGVTRDPNAKFPLHNEEKLFFGRYAENRPSNLLFLELLKLWCIKEGIVEENTEAKRARAAKLKEKPNTFTDRMVTFVRESFDHQYVSTKENESISGWRATTEGELEFPSNGNTLMRNWYALLRECVHDWRCVDKTPVLYEVFSLAHLFHYMESLRSILLPKLRDTPELYNPVVIFGLRPPVVIRNDERARSMQKFDIELVLREFATTMTMTNSISVEIEDCLVLLTGFPGFREMFITREINSQNPKHLMNKPSILATMDENSAKCFKAFQPDLFDQLRGEDMMKLQDNWHLVLDKDFRFHDTYYLLLFHYFLQEQEQFSFWRERYLSRFNDFMRDMETILKRSDVEPRFVQVQAYTWCLLWKQHLYTSEHSIFVLLYTYINLVKTRCKGLLYAENKIVTKVPQVLGWYRDLNYLFGQIEEAWRTEVDLNKTIDVTLPKLHAEAEQKRKEEDEVDEETLAQRAREEENKMVNEELKLMFRD
jgi:hypothetical protein